MSENKKRHMLGYCHNAGAKSKLKYLNRKEADGFILEKGYNLRSYHCSECDYFHLTSRMSNSRAKLSAPSTKSRNKRKPRRLI